MTKTVKAIREEVASTAVKDGSEAIKSLEQGIQEAIEQARAACEAKGNSSSDCAVAWDIVEELQAERSHRLAVSQPKTSLDNYCKEHPEAMECLIYDV
jgi:signal transduction histidine kinase